ncbi:lipoate--protein ligase family protein [Arthrobacter sp. STN4]|uniref:lipoate--protein ligase family protein n=1 Tax=Arthrobacter sp. STN4 TaxID=2923276 RepID=UPI002119D5E0|nr:lipoate--protein ligase family protein [Arthrobacter sp. STN4]MCQ9163846.1 lipoate--protein ligase family protein [Arthrobacter sp. STN4]
MNRFLAPRLAVHRQVESLGAEADLNRGLDLLADVKAGRLPATLRLYRPEPTVAFGQRDTRLPGFAEAREASLARGFVPAVRRAGGRAAAYHQGTLVVDHIQPQEDSIADAKARFGFFGGLFTDALRSLGVDAGVGEIPGEYCPGEFSVFGRGAAGHLKLVGTAQRVVAGAWLFSSVIVVENSAPIREVLVDTYAALGLDWDPRTAGAAEDLVPGTTVDAVEAAVLAAYGSHVQLA